MEQFTFEQIPNAITLVYDKLNNIERLLLVKSNENLPESDQLLNIIQTGELLNLSVPTIYGLVHQSKIPVMKKGKRLYFSKDDIVAWIKTGRRKTLAEIEAGADQFLVKRKGLTHGK